MTRVLNAERLAKRLAALPEVAKLEIQAAMETAANEIVALAKSLVPVESGALRGSIGWTWGKAPKGSISLATARSGELTLTIYAGDDTAFYARWVEFGTGPHVAGGLFKGATNPGTPARPFFYPAYRASRKGAKSKIRAAARRAAKKVAAS